jgi:RimJ/RimL family protein N-acetyltransferase
VKRRSSKGQFAAVNAVHGVDIMRTLLETDRLRLRRFTETDGDALFELDNDPQVMRFLSGGTPTPRDIVQTVILPRFLQYDECFPSYGFWATIERATGEFLEWFSFVPSEANPVEIALGFRLRRVVWGKGYATEGAQALVRRAFTELDVQRVVATTYEHNLASHRVLEKVGMRIVRRFRLTPQDVARATTYHPGSLEPWDGDEVEYAIERREWERQPPRPI